MASAMHQSMQTCHNLCTMVQSQMLDEDKIDPFPARTTVELNEMHEACLRVKEVLAREELIYSKNADFTKYTDQELVAMNAFVRENSRMLSIILAGGAHHFWNGQGLSTAQELKNMYHYIDDKVKEFFLIDKIIDTLEIKTKYGRKGAATATKVSLSNHPEALAFAAIDANRAPTSQETLLRLASVCEKFAVQCRAVSQTRSLKMEDRARKMEVKEKLMVEIDSVLPALRMHVLRIGLSKTQLKDTAQKAAAASGGSHAHKLTSLFTHRAVEEAHRDVENCKERLMQEMLFRRAKVERRLKREEEAEIESQKQLASLPPGAKAKAASRDLVNMPAYQSVLADQPESPSRGHNKGHRSPSGGRSPSHDRSPSPSGPSESEKDRQSKGRTRTQARFMDSTSRASTASPQRGDSPGGNSPKGRHTTKSPQKEGVEKKGGSKSRPKTTVLAEKEEGSPRKSPKARSRRAAQTVR